MSTATTLLPIRVPSVGESITSGVLGSWKKKNGDSVSSGEALFEIETDKVTSEVFAEADGTIEILVPEGTEVKVGQTVGNLHPGKAPSRKSTPTETPKREKVEVAPLPKSPTRQAQPTPSPVLIHSEADAAVVSPSSRSDRETRKKMSPIRRKIADRLVSAQQTAAILTTFNEADLSNLIALRTEVQPTFQAQHGVKLGFMSFFLQAAVHALKTVPALNARIEGDEIVTQHYFDIGVAVGSPRGLVVPILRNADQLSFADIEKAIGDFGKKAQDGKLSLEDLTGGTFSISNGGVFGSMLSTPIINPPQSAILGVHATKDRAVVENGQVVVRPINYLALSYDHRIIDGREAVLALVAMKEALEDPARLLLDL